MAVSPYVSRAEVWLANSSFRSSFKLPEHFHPSLFVKWFPGHMAKGLRLMESLVRKCDCVLEVHDARIPFSGRNPKFRQRLNGRPSILVLNKLDLIEPAKRKEVLKKFESQGIRAVFSDSKSQYHYSIKRIVPAVLEAMKDAEYDGSYIRKDPDKPYHLLVCGLPNTGKSSLINALRRTYLGKGKGTRVGKHPGMTTAIQERVMINDEPKMYMFDTPGCFKDHMIGEDLIADYILYTLNKTKKMGYVSRLSLESPSDNIDFVLRHLAVNQDSYREGYTLDYLKASIQFISRYRKGEFGHFMLDIL